jgi:hypothetical protein
VSAWTGPVLVIVSWYSLVRARVAGIGEDIFLLPSVGGGGGRLEVGDWAKGAYHLTRVVALRAWREMPW